MSCECAFCRRHERLQQIAGRSAPDDAAFLGEIENALAHAEENAVYWKAKYEGTWPGDEAARPKVRHDDAD